MDTVEERFLDVYIAVAVRDLERELAKCKSCKRAACNHCEREKNLVRLEAFFLRGDSARLRRYYNEAIERSKKNGIHREKRQDFNE